MADVATTKLFENEQLAVWEMVLQPGESSGLHTHNHSYIFSVFEGSTIEVTDADGVSCGAIPMQPGATFHFQLDGSELVAGDLRIPAVHAARNIGETRFKEILIETKSC